MGVCDRPEKEILDIRLKYVKKIGMWPYQVKVTSNKSRHVINIPAKLARETGIDKADYVLITKSADNKLEIKRYDSEIDYKEYLEGV